MSLKSYDKYLEITALGNAANPEEPEKAQVIFSKMLSSHPSKIKQIFADAIARGELKKDPSFEDEMKNLLKSLPGSIVKPTAMLDKLHRRKRREQDPLHNVVARAHDGGDASGDGTGGGD